MKGKMNSYSCQLKKITRLVFVLTFFVSGCQEVGQTSSRSIKVGVFAKYGVCQYCVIDVVESLRIDGEIEAKTVSASEVMGGVLDDLDVVVFPGGSGRIETVFKQLHIVVQFSLPG